MFEIGSRLHGVDSDFCWVRIRDVLCLIYGTVTVPELPLFPDLSGAKVINRIHLSWAIRFPITFHLFYTTFERPRMSVQAPGHNKQYTEIEEQILVYFKTQCLSWPEILTEYNKRVDLDRQRTQAALETKWRQLKPRVYIG
jgi:hypothetical protein